MQLDFLFDVESVERETVPDEPGAVLLHFTSGEFSAEVWTDAEGMGELAQGIIEARQKLEGVPIVARLAGTNLEEGLKMLESSGISVERADDLGEAARKAVAAATK